MKTLFTEEIAQFVYNAMRFERRDETNGWFANGNSLAQDEARQTANKILARCSHIQPIETAPKDGIKIDLYIPLIDQNNSIVKIERWHEAQWNEAGYWERHEGYPVTYKRLLVEPLGWSPILKFPEGGL